MKTNSKTKTAAKQTPVLEQNQVAGASHSRAVPLDQILNDFLKVESEKRGEKTSDGVNDNLDAFAHTMRFILNNEREFDFNRYISLVSKRYDSTSPEVANLYHAFVAELKKHHRCNTFTGAYCQPLITLK